MEDMFVVYLQYGGLLIFSLFVGNWLIIIVQLELDTYFVLVNLIASWNLGFS